MKRVILSSVCTIALTAGSYTVLAQNAPPASPQPNQAAVVAPAVPASPSVKASDGQIIAAVPSQNAPQVPMTPIEKEISDQLSFQSPNVNVNMIPSLFFTVWEHDLVLDARRGLTTRDPVTEDGLAASGPRDITLGGIVYVGKKDWTIWLNDMRVSPTAIPDEVMDLKVFKDYIELEWFDASTNQIFPIRLRSHQRFNLDTRLFLPG
ncbi:MAG: hypothetical protein DI551_11615 [Micavibrio aeruginosavorus]|uniref:Uncharacterized protein n=1 Tax=Micavibrio aeruginosavorus TaxID=349221 RepID=A0A2W5PGM9_9BACT|nr:MAG: hypothetical protein DI551_11615 [Micavibrio aeruginosavorus]